MIIDDPERLARALHETSSEHLERWSAQAVASGRLTGIDPWVPKPFDELPEGSRRDLIRAATAAANRYEELGA